MKNLLPTFILIVLLLTNLVSTPGQHCPPVQTLNIPYSSNVVDGTQSSGEWYSPIQSTCAFNVTGSTGDDADFTCSFQIACNEVYLYLFVVILDEFDNSVEYTTTPNAFEYDCVELFLDLDTAGSGTNPDYDSNTIQLRFNRGLTDSVQTPGRAAQEEYELYVENTTSGWLMEAAIPWTCVLAEGQLPEDICDYKNLVHGFDLSGVDSDQPGPGHRDCQTAWDSDDPGMPDATEDLAWNNRTVFGVVTFNYYLCTEPYIPSTTSIYRNNTISLYPNPAGNTIHFELEGLQTIKILGYAHATYS